MHRFKSDKCEISYIEAGRANDGDAPVVIWGHGWGQEGVSFAQLTSALGHVGRHICIDFPGFGASPIPFERIEDSWGSEDYAHAMADFIQEVVPSRKIVWVGHSFGCRVGVQLAALYPDLVKGVVFIAGAGLQPKRSLLRKLYLATKVATYKLGKRLQKIAVLDKLVQVIGVSSANKGSSDYQNAAEMRGVLVKVVNEDLVAEAEKVSCPALLLYGDKDFETPLSIAEKFKKLMKDAKLFVLKGEDHYTVLNGSGVHQVSMRIKSFLQQLI